VNPVFIKERDESFLNFFSPSILIIIGLLVLSIGAIGLIIVNYWIPILIPDPTLATIQINLFGQILGIIVVMIFLIPLFRLKEAESEKPTLMRTLKTFGVACLSLTVSMLIALIFWILFTALGIPIESSYGGFVLTPEQIANPWNLVLLFTTVTVGAAIFEELIFRRMLIPALEHRGMAPLVAVIASSIGFALIHVPNDIINGSISYVITHFITTFALGMFLGLIYITTRNVLYPIIIHGFINFFAFTELILATLDDFTLLIIFALIILIVWGIGIVIGVLLLVFYFRDPPPRWAEILRRRSQINILPGLAGYLIIGFILISLPVIADMVITLLAYPNIYLIYSLSFLFYLVIFFILAVIAWYTKYEPTIPELQEPEPHPLYEKAEDVTLEPRPE
jgi:membrane protease YdiL (CAAX protease family)